MIRVEHGDSRDVLKTLADCSVDAVVTDPPYALVSIQKRFGKPGSAEAKDRDGLYKRASAGFMGQQWDTGEVAFDPEFWAEVLRVLKPGGHLLAFSGTRTYHRLACAIEDAGFEIRDQIGWCYASGFPKSHDVSKAIDKRGGAQVAWFGPWLKAWRAENNIKQSDVSALFPSKTGGKTGCVANWELGLNMPTPEQFNLICSTFGLPFGSLEEAEREVLGIKHGTRLAVAPGQQNDRGATSLEVTAPATPEAKQWQGWGTALKPAWEPICLARKPLVGTVAENVLRFGTGALNIDGCRVGDEERYNPAARNQKPGVAQNANILSGTDPSAPGRVALGRWPANIIHDGSEEVIAAFPEAPGQQGVVTGNEPSSPFANVYGDMPNRAGRADPRADAGSAARFFKSCEYTPEEIQWMSDRANCVDETLSLQSEAAVSALRLALERSTPGWALNFADYRAPSTSATPSELRLISAIAIEMIQIIERRCSLGWPLERLSLTLSHAECAAIPRPTGTIMITISRWKSSGSAEPVTFSITPKNAGLGAAGLDEPVRFHYSAKADAADRLGSKHPTVKPVDLMAYLCRLVTPPGGTVLDPFAGSGTTGMACMREGFNAILIEREAQFVADIKRRIAHVSGQDAPLFAEVAQ